MKEIKQTGLCRPGVHSPNVSASCASVAQVMERMPGPAGPPQRFTAAERWDYTVAELRGIAAEHGLPTPSRLTHVELVQLITTAGVPLPPKLPERMQPFRRRRGPLAD